MIVSILYLKEGFNPTILAGDNGYEKFTNDQFYQYFFYSISVLHKKSRLKNDFD